MCERFRAQFFRIENRAIKNRKEIPVLMQGRLAPSSPRERRSLAFAALMPPRWLPTTADQMRQTGYGNLACAGHNNSTAAGDNNTYSDEERRVATRKVQ